MFEASQHKENLEKPPPLDRELHFQPVKFDVGGAVRAVAEVTDGTFKLQLEKEGRETFNMGTIAPPGTVIRPNKDGVWKAWWRFSEGKAPEFGLEVGEFKNAEGVLAFLHEIGHLRDLGTGEAAAVAKVLSILETEKDALQSYPESRIRALQEEHRLIIQSERNAWAFALKKVRELKRGLGVDIVEKVGGTGNVLALTNEFLSKHEMPYLKNFLEILGSKVYSEEEIISLIEGFARRKKRQVKGAENADIAQPA